MPKDTWNFENFTSHISPHYYNDLFGLAVGNIMWVFAKTFGKDGMKGHCFGMVATAINSFYGTPPVTSYGVNKLFDVSLKDQCADPKLQTAEDFINYGHVYQFSKDVQAEMGSTENDLQKLHQAVTDYENGGVPVNIYMRGNGAHQVLALSVTDYDGFSIINVYDCNYPNTIRPLYLYKVGASFTGWDFQLESGEMWGTDNNSSISYTTKSNNLYNNIGRSRAPITYNLVHANGAALSITNGKQSATVIGNESNNLNLIIPISYAEAVEPGSEESNSYLYWIDMGEELEFIDTAANSNLMIAAGDNGIAVNTSVQSTITVNVSADRDNKSILIETTDGQSNNTTTLTYYGNDGNDNLEIVTIEAATDSVLSSTDNENGIKISGIKSLSIQIEDDAVALPNISEDYSYQIEAEDGKIVSVKADTNGDNVYDTTIYTSKEGTTPYTVIFNANGGTVIPTTMATNEDGKLILITHRN